MASAVHTVPPSMGCSLSPAQGKWPTLFAATATPLEDDGAAADEAAEERCALLSSLRSIRYLRPVMYDKLAGMVLCRSAWMLHFKRSQ